MVKGRAGVTALALLFWRVTIVGGSPSPAAATVTTTPSSAAGGGYENTIAVDPNNANDTAVGGDVSGVEVSTNAGQSWSVG